MKIAGYCRLNEKNGLLFTKTEGRLYEMALVMKIYLRRLRMAGR